MVAVVTVLSACGPERPPEVPEEWFLGEWFVWGDQCPRSCTPETLVQVEVEPDGVAVIHREAICNPSSRKDLVWSQEEPDVVRFEPADPESSPTGLQDPDFEFFTFRYVDECRAIAEESENTFRIRRGPASLMRENPLDCDGVIVPEDETTNVACLEAE